MKKSVDCKNFKQEKFFKNSFNVVYLEDKNIIPEIDDVDLLNFGMVFMKIRARELNKYK